MKKLSVIAALTASIFALAGCGGGGSSSSNTSSSPSSTSVSGTVATGAVLSSATVEVYDANGQLVGTTTTDANGQYSLSGIDTSKYRLPIIIKAYGQVGDSNVTLHSISSTGGTTNVNQLTNAIVTSLSTNGDPGSLTAGNSLNSTAIGSAVTAYAEAIWSLRSAFNTGADFVSAQHNDNYDAMLDNVSAQVLPSGKVILSTSQGKDASNQIGNVSNGFQEGSGISSIELEHGQLPVSSQNGSMPPPSNVLTVKKLQALTEKLNACFTKPAASRVTQTTTNAGASANWVNLAQDCSDLATSDFKHDGNYWIDSNSGCSSSRYCLGMFGQMLVSSGYDGAEFLPQTNIVAAGDNKWFVKFPVKYADGSIGQISDVTGGDDMVVTYNPIDGKYRLSGNQRDAGVSITSSVQKIANVKTGAYRYETGLVVGINSTSVRTLKKNDGTTVHVTKAKVTGKGLPSGGVVLANKLSTSRTNNYAILGTSGNFRNACSGYLNFEYESVVPSVGDYTVNTPNAASCSGFMRLAYTDTPSGIYGMTVTPTVIKGWTGRFLSEDELAQITSGEPYTFELTYSDGTIRTYIKRLSYPVLTLANAQRQSYPLITNTDFASFDGSTTPYVVTWEKLYSSFLTNVKLYWSRAATNSSKSISQGTSSVAFDCSRSGSTPYCGDSGSWYYNGSSTPNSGIIQLMSRTIDGLQIMSQQRQY